MTHNSPPTSMPPIGDDDLQAYIDERLPEARRALVQAYLDADPAVSARVTAERNHRAALRDQLHSKFHEPIPARLRAATLRASYAARRSAQRRSAAAALLLFAIGLGGGWLARDYYSASQNAAQPDHTALLVTDDALAAYRTFVVEVTHPVEVAADNEAHLMRWLSKRLGRQLAAPVLRDFGYAFVGGRLLPGGSGAAAQLMYDRADGSRLTLYVQAGAGNETAFRFTEQGETATFAWIDGGFGFAVTAPTARETLLPIAEAIYHQFDGGNDAG
jgi:anti-sigma factor RsiW